MRKIFFLFLLYSITICAFSQTKKIKDLERERKQMLKEIENTNKLLLDTKKTTTTLDNRIKLISKQIQSRQSVLSLLDQEIKGITSNQGALEKEIKQLEEELKKQQQSYAVAVKGMINKKQTSNRLLFILSGKTLGESVRRMKYMKDYSEWRNEQAEEIKAKKEILAEKKLALENSREEKLQLMSERKAEQDKLKQEELIRQGEMKEATQKQKELQAELKKKQKKANALNAQIERLIAEEVARQEKEAKRIAAAKAKTEKSKPSTVKSTDAVPVKETKESFALSKNFAANKGKFPMPVTGRCTITGRFGQHQHNLYKVTTNSNGIDIQAQSGAEARSIFDGEVSRVMAFPGYNNCIIIRHGGYYTFYGNIQQVYVKQGQKVSAAQSLGKVYTDSDTGVSELHFQLWKGTTKLNPEPWLKR